MARLEKSITLAGQQSEDIETINQVVFKMDEVTQHGAALLEQAEALAHSLDEWATGDVRVQACRGAVILVATIR